MATLLAVFTLTARHARYGGGVYRKGDQITTQRGTPVFRDLLGDARWSGPTSVQAFEDSVDMEPAAVRARAEEKAMERFASTLELVESHAEQLHQADDLEQKAMVKIGENPASRKRFIVAFLTLGLHFGMNTEEDLEMAKAAPTEDFDSQPDDNDEEYEIGKVEARGGDEDDNPGNDPEPETDPLKADAPPAAPEPEPEPGADPEPSKTLEEEVVALAREDLSDLLEADKGTKGELVDLAVRAGLKADPAWAAAPSAGGLAVPELRGRLKALLLASS